jgi:ankyrin repeat protein
MSHCHTCQVLRAELASKISEIRNLRAALANQTATPCSPSGSAPMVRVSPPPSAHVSAKSHPIPATSSLSVLHPLAKLEALGRGAEAQVEACVSAPPAPYVPPAPCISLNTENPTSESRPESSRGLPPAATRPVHVARVSDALQACDRVADAAPSSDDDVFAFDPNLTSALFDMFGQKFSRAFIERVLDKVRWDEGEAVSVLLAEASSAPQETGAAAPRAPRPLLHEPQRARATPVVSPALPCDISCDLPLKSPSAIASVKPEVHDHEHAPPKPKAFRPLPPASDSKRPKIDFGPQIRKLKADICHEMESGRDCLQLIRQFQALCPATWFSDPLIATTGFVGPRIFHLACCSDAFSSTLAFLMDHVVRRERGAEHCRELMMMPVCASFVDWNKDFGNCEGADKKRMSRIPRKQAGPDKMSYSLGLKCCALHVAAHHGALSCAAMLLKMAQRVEPHDSKSMFVADLLVQGGSVKDVKYRDWAPSPLDLASAAGHVNVMRLFVHHIRQLGPHSTMSPAVFVNHRGRGSSCALHWAAECSKFESIEFLLQQGADAEAKDDTGGTAVEYVINNASRQPLIPAQEQDDAAIWTPDDGWLAQIQSFTKLLQYGARTRLASDSSEVSATAALHGYYDFCGSKLQAAVLSKNMAYLQTILYEFWDGTHQIDHCFQMQKHDSKSCISPLGIACLMGWSEGVLMLLEAGARQHPDELKKMTPLMLAAANHHDHIIRILVSPRFLSSMFPREHDGAARLGDAATGCARFRLQKSTSASKLGARGSCTQRYYSALLDILEAKSSNDRRAVDWAALHDKQSACAVFLRKLHETASSAQRSADTTQLVSRRALPSEPVILQRSFLSWEYMRFFALKYIEGQRARPVSAQTACVLPTAHLAEGCSCSAMFCIPGLCFCLKGDFNSRGAADLGCLRDDGMNMDLDFSNPFVGEHCEMIIRTVLEHGFSVRVFGDFDMQMYTMPPNHDTDCNWFSIGTKLATSDSAAAFANPPNEAPCLSLINLVGAGLALQLLPRLLSLRDSDSTESWKWRGPLYTKFRQEVSTLLCDSASDPSQRAACFASFKKKVHELSFEFSRVCEGSSCWGRAMLQDWQDFGLHLWRAELLCCDTPLSLCYNMKDLACRFRCMQSHLRIRVRSKPSKHSPHVGQLLLCDAAKCGCPCALTPDQVMHLGVIPTVLDKRPSEFCQPGLDGSPGLGLYTTIHLQTGSLIAPYIGELMLSRENMQDEEQYTQEGLMCYAFELPLSEDSNLRPPGRENKVVVDPTRFGGLARYVNHSCHPNLHFVMVRAGKDLPVLYLYACTDIAAGTELTMSYGSQLTYACMCSQCKYAKAKKLEKCTANKTH